MSNENQLQRFPNGLHGCSRFKNFYTEVDSNLTNKMLSTGKENRKCHNNNDFNIKLLPAGWDKVWENTMAEVNTDVVQKKFKLE